MNNIYIWAKMPLCIFANQPVSCISDFQFVNWWCKSVCVCAGWSRWINGDQEQKVAGNFRLPLYLYLYLYLYLQSESKRWRWPGSTGCHYPHSTRSPTPRACWASCPHFLPFSTLELELEPAILQFTKRNVAEDNTRSPTPGAELEVDWLVGLAKHELETFTVLLATQWMTAQ